MADRSLFCRTEKLADPAFQYVRTLDFAFPDYESCPSVSLEQIDVVEIPLDVPVEFPIPELTVGTWSSTPRTIVLMPETTVDENYLLVLGKYKIRGSRKIPAVQSKSESESMRDFAFPDYESCPSVSLEQIDVVEIPLDVPVEFPIPELTVGTWSSTPRTIVLMPETTVDENYLLVLGKYKIRGSRKIPAVQSKSESESMRDFANSNLRRCVATSYATHQPAPLDRRKVVRHVGTSVCGSLLVQLYTLHGRTGVYSSGRTGRTVRCRVHLPCPEAHEIDHRETMMDAARKLQTICFEPCGRIGLLTLLTLRRPERLNVILPGRWTRTAVSLHCSPTLHVWWEVAGRTSCSWRTFPGCRRWMRTANPSAAAWRDRSTIRFRPVWRSSSAIGSPSI